MTGQLRPKHVPVRTCVVCRKKAAKRTLTRVVRTDEGVMIDPAGKLRGRGAYVCDQASCWNRALTTPVLAKALRTTLTDADRDRLSHARPVP